MAFRSPLVQSIVVQSIINHPQEQVRRRSLVPRRSSALIFGPPSARRQTPASLASCDSCALRFPILTLGGCTTCLGRYGAPLLSKDMADGVAVRCVSRSTSVTPFPFALQA